MHAFANMNNQFWHITGPILVGIIGFVISMSTENVAARYIALFLQASSYAGFIVFYSWISSSFPRPPAKRAVALAIINAFSQLGNVAGSYVWSLSDNGYRKSYGIVTAMFGVAIVGCFVFRGMLARLNREIEMVEQQDGETAQERAAEIGGEEHPEMKKGFRYLV
jgi:predicted MFS family arabinose efflux permease